MSTAELEQQHPTTLAFELFASVPDAVADPHTRYRILREQAPVHRIELPSGVAVWVLSRYDDCKAVLASHHFGTAAGREDQGRGLGLMSQELPEMPVDRVPPMLFLNPPDHTRIRGLFSRAFTPRRIEALRSHIGELVDEILLPLRDGGEVDLLDALAFPLPVAVIGELVGVPVADRPRFRSLVRDGAASLELNADAEVIQRSARAMVEMRDYFADLVEERRVRPADDLLSALLAVEDDGDTLSRDELISNVILLFAAGFETTTNLIGNGVAALCANPDELARLQQDRSLVPAAVEEILRYESPVQLDGRYAMVDTTLPDGTAVPEGETAITLLGAANRDPARFDDPERFDIGRTDNAPLSFAWGIHHCIGAGLARAEGVETFSRLLDAFAGIELLDDPPRWRQSLTLRGLDALPVRLTPA
ncbi:MAG: cytochrome P450 [Actinomycetota bacterium]|nr:cytochrome P450 [Acidimicrobiia bacterium]MDQ3293794.1 cytochrome P450 [Actinomycetota bacterium]